jgi:hypothetical protein
MLRIRYLYFWVDFDMKYFNFLFKDYDYVIVNDDSYNVLMLSVFANSGNYTQINNNCIKIMYIGEPYNIFEEFVMKTNIIPDIIWGYEPSKNKIPVNISLYYPLWLLEYYDLVVNVEELKKKNKEILELYKTKNDKGILICRHDRNNTRMPLVNIINKYYQIDFGGSFKKNISINIPQHESIWQEKKIEFLNNYLFNICSENIQQMNYNTEKLFHACISGTIPIYYGYIGELEKKIFNIDRIIKIDSINPETLNTLENIILIYKNYPSLLEYDYKKPVFLTENVEYIKKYRQNIINIVSNYIKSRIPL